MERFFMPKSKMFKDLGDCGYIYTHIDTEDVSCVIEHSATLNFNDLKCQSSCHIVQSRFETYRHRNNRNCNYTF